MPSAPAAHPDDVVRIHHGVLPLVIASGAGSELRRAMGIAVFSGMLGVTFFGLFLTPVFFVAIELALRGGRSAKVSPAITAPGNASSAPLAADAQPGAPR